MSTTRKSPQALRTISHGSVLVALDGSPAANMALPIARVFARQLGARLEILHVAQAPIGKEAACKNLGLTPKELKGADLRILVGAPAEGILEVARSPETQLIVLSTHGRVIEPGHRLGRVAEAVIATTDRPVVLVRPEAMIGREHIPARIKRMLVPLDGTKVTFGALAPATELASKLHAEVNLLFVVSPGQPAPPETVSIEPGSIHAPCYVDQPQHEWPQWSREATMRLITQAGCPSGVRARGYLGFGDISTEVIQFAKHHKEDIIVLVRRSHFESGRARVLRKVLKYTPCPIFLLAARPKNAS